MKSYKEYEKVYIGSSDIASLIFDGLTIDGIRNPQIVNFGMDSSYYAYIVPENTEIGEHYKWIGVFFNWLKVYDDDRVVFKTKGERIDVWRAGEMGCIIQVTE